MPFTNFPNGVSSLGNPVLPGGVPIMGRFGKAFFVDGARGSDGHRGTDWRKPLATVTKAYSLTTDKAGDVIYLLNDGNTSGTSRDAATITWSNDNTHLVGFCAPTNVSQRARISPPTSATAIVTPQLNVTGNGNSFHNFSLFEGTSEDATASICVQVTGSRNYFNNVAMMNMGDVASGHSGDETGSAHLKITGEENYFEGCYIGIDTTLRSVANANVWFTSAAARNTFSRCMFTMNADANSPLFVKIGSGGIDRWARFLNCEFINVVNSGASTTLGAFDVHASAGGTVMVKDCSLIGASDWEAASNTNIWLMGPVPAAATTGISVQQTT